MRFTIRLLFATLLAAGTCVGATRSDLSLDGDWHFLADPDGALDVPKLTSAAGVRPTRVPASWQTQFSDLRDYAGVAWYWRTVNLDQPATDQVALLRFGAVDYVAQVYVNGQMVGAHEGGYLPFEFDVTSRLHTGENQIAVRVTDAGAPPRDVVEGIRYAEIPHGKQNWYIQTSGLWQSVALDFRPALHFGAVHISAAADGSFVIDVPLQRGNSARPATVVGEVQDAGGKSLWRSSQDLPGAAVSAKLTGAVPTPQLWSPFNPYLYKLQVTLSSGDTYECPFGFRTFNARDGKFYLNGKPIYLRGALDQDFYPDSVYTPASLDYVRDEMRKAKSLGLNLLRCHIKVPDPRYLQAADETGVLIWYEIPNWDKLTADSQHRSMETLKGMVERDANHPSIVMVSIINESWGANLKEPSDRAWLKSAYHQAKSFVPWMVDDNSACCDNFHVATDISDFHTYSAIPDYPSNFDRLLDDMVQRPGWLFSPYGDSESKGDEPLMLSEFGNWGLPHLPEETPWWFNRDRAKREITLPAGVDQRFHDYHYESIFPDLNALLDATEWHEYQALKYEIGVLRSRPEIQGYVITEFTDVNWEANGLLDMWRHPKVFGNALSRLQQDDLLILHTDKANYHAGEAIQADAYVSHYSAQDWTNARVDWQFEGTSLAGSIPLNTVPIASSAKVGTIRFSAPGGTSPVKRNLKAQLKISDKPISGDSLDYYIYPNKQLDLPPPVAFYDPPPGRLRRLVNDMRARNYLAPSGAEAYPVLITSTLDESVKSKLRAGARVILIAADPITLAPGVEVVPRGEQNFSGNWVSNFLWLRRDHAPFSDPGFNTLGGFETQSVTPGAIVTGIPPQNFGDVLAGMFYGWLNANSGVLVQAKAGKGKLLICTFSLATTYNSDPYATDLLDAMVNYVISDFAPHFELPL